MLNEAELKQKFYKLQTTTVDIYQSDLFSCDIDIGKHNDISPEI